MGVVDHRDHRLNAERRITPLRVVAAGAAVLIVLFVAGLLPVEAVRVSSDSMAPTVRNGDQLLVEHSPADLRRGDLVVIDDPDGSGLLVKRLIGLGGDRFAIEDGVVVVNGAALVEPYTDRTRIDGVYVGPLTVAPGQLYVLGDNRGESVDSRDFGPVPDTTVIGRVTIRLWPATGGL